MDRFLKHDLLQAVAWTLLAALIYICSQIAAGFWLYGRGIRPDAFSEAETWDGFAIYLLAAALVVGGVALVGRWLKTGKKSLREQLGLKSLGWQSVGYGLAGFGIYFVLTLVVMQLLAAAQLVDLNQRQDVGFNNIAGWELLPAFIALVILAPISEEILMRGFLYIRLRHLVGRLAAVVSTSLLFAIMHGQVNVAADTFVMSLVSIYLLEETKGLGASIVLHATKNAVAFTLVYVVAVG